MTITHILGYPRIGEKRELKFALEQYWRGDIQQADLYQVGQALRAKNWQTQKEAGLSWVTVGDFAWYDQVLNTSLLLGHVPKRHRDGFPTLDTMFKIARGQSQQDCGCEGNAASDMTKWFNTNYHYIVPEFHPDDTFNLSWPQLFEEVNEAQKLGHKVKAVLLGPLSYLYLGQSQVEEFDPLTLLPRLLAAYQAILAKLAKQGVEWVQMDEPILALELDDAWLNAYKLAYQIIRSDVKVLLTTYFDGIESSLEQIVELAVDGLHIDVTSAPEQLAAVAERLPKNWVLSVGAINGRNVWRSNLSAQHAWLAPLKQQFGDRLWLASSCSLLHSPVDLTLEQQLTEETKSWFAFAKQKVKEVALLANALAGEEHAIEQCAHYSAPIEARLTAKHVHKASVQARLAGWHDQLADREAPYAVRAEAQKKQLSLPLLPTTTIGSFPQTGDIRTIRHAHRQGHITQSVYEDAIKTHIYDAVKRQEALGLDVLVHGEAERNDMVEYFAEQLDGFQTTQFGWVQSYGSRCVKPAIAVADIERSAPITVNWSSYAQSLTEKQMKGMLTGPVTVLCWTFPREDITREQMARQLALALRDEVTDLQLAGIDIIQIDEPAIREGLPLKSSEHEAYLAWAVNAFKVAAGSAKVTTQIHTHMCYSEFNSIIGSVAALDADVITIETSRSNMQLLSAFEAFNYPNEIGPGVYDIHSPNIPTQDWIEALLRRAAERIPVERLWVNPDCGLKTRNWSETEAALTNMVNAAKALRDEYVSH